MLSGRQPAKLCGLYGRMDQQHGGEPGDFAKLDRPSCGGHGDDAEQHGADQQSRAVLVPHYRTHDGQAGSCRQKNANDGGEGGVFSKLAVIQQKTVVKRPVAKNHDDSYLVSVINPTKTLSIPQPSVCVRKWKEESRKL